MGQVNYPPATRRPDTKVDDIRQKTEAYRRRASRELPTAQAKSGVILVLPDDFSKTTDVIDRWESITKNHVSRITWSSNQEKVDYIENLMGETEKKTCF